MTQDPVIEAINDGTLTKEDLTPEKFRERFRRKVYEDGREHLNRGRGILEDIDKLDQYLHSYGKMVNNQWQNITNFEILEASTTIIDYGCGQGLSLLNFLDTCEVSTEGKTWADLPESVVLIEPSIVALSRAKAIANLYFPKVEIKTINKSLEQLNEQDLKIPQSEVTIHIFSQVLDMEFEENFDLIDFIEKITAKKGFHYLIIVSHHIEKLDSSRNILKLYKHLVANYIHDEINLDNILGVTEQANDYIKDVKSIALNNFEIESGHSSIGVFACIETN